MKNALPSPRARNLQGKNEASSAHKGTPHIFHDNILLFFYYFQQFIYIFYDIIRPGIFEFRAGAVAKEDTAGF